MKKYVATLLLGLTMNVHVQSKSHQEYLAQSYEGLVAVTEVHNKTWGFGTEKSWDVDLNAGKIFFTFEDGIEASADVQVVGTLANGTFMWGWNHPSVVGKPSKHAALLKEYGAKNNIAVLLQQPAVISEEQAWKYTALAMRLGNNSGAYKAKAGSTLIYMTFGDIQLTKPQINK